MHKDEILRLHTLQENAALEEWLRTVGVARYDAYHRDRTRGCPAAEVFARIRGKRDAVRSAK